MTIFEDLLFQDNSFFVCCSTILAATSGFHCRHLLPKTLSSIARIKARKRKLLPIIVPLQYFRLFFKIFLFFACSSKIPVIRIQLCYFTHYFIMSQHHSENSMGFFFLTSWKALHPIASCSSKEVQLSCNAFSL